MDKHGYVYILANQPRGNTYIGVTSQLEQRLQQHQETLAFSYTKRYHIMRLVWAERHDTMEAAIMREKRLKKWKKEWKYNLIEATNPNWDTISCLDY